MSRIQTPGLAFYIGHFLSFIISLLLNTSLMCFVETLCEQVTDFEYGCGLEVAFRSYEKHQLSEGELAVE